MSEANGQPRKLFSVDVDLDEPGPEFTVEYVLRRSGQETVREERTFRCLSVKRVNGPMLLYFYLAAEEKLETRLKASMDFLTGVVVPEQRQEFKDLLMNPDRQMSADVLVGIMQHLQEVYADRPTSAPSGSPDGRSGTEDTSQADASSPESIPTPST